MEKIEIARSFSQTKQVSAYQPIQVFASYKATLEKGESEKKVSEELYRKAKADVEEGINEFTSSNGINPKRLISAVDKISVRKPMVIEEYESLSPIEKDVIQAVKRAYARSPMHKATLEKRSNNKSTEPFEGSEFNKKK